MTCGLPKSFTQLQGYKPWDCMGDGQSVSSSGVRGIARTSSPTMTRAEQPSKEEALSLTHLGLL